MGEDKGGPSPSGERMLGVCVGNAYSLVLLFLPENPHLSWPPSLPPRPSPSCPSLGAGTFLTGSLAEGPEQGVNRPPALTLLSPLLWISLFSGSGGSAAPSLMHSPGASVLSVLRGCDRSQVALAAECTCLIQEPSAGHSHLRCYPRFHWWREL